MPYADPNKQIAEHLGSLTVVLAVFVLVVGFMQAAMAHEQAQMCGPINDGDGDPVLQSDGDILLYSGSFRCPPEEVEITNVSSVEPISAIVYFEFDVAVPNTKGDAALMEILADLKGLAPQLIIVAGHADRSGPEAYNLDLSSRRAQHVAEWLIDSGISATVVTTEAYGETKPAVPTADGVREPANRRVVLDIEFQTSS